jgi:hypothetical protein
MTKRSLRRLMQLVLAAAATDAAIACGGAVTSINSDPEGDESPATPQPTGTATSKTDPPEIDKPDATTKPDANKPDASKPDASKPDATTIDANKADVVQTCVTGTIAPDPKYCCKDPQDPNCNNGGGGGGDGEKCALNCQSVCDSVAPGPKMFDWCSYTADGKISYYCGACGVGRIPEGTEPCTRGRSVGERLAMQAYYEAVSVIAFERLADALEREGAPTSLVRRARRAAAEEDRHAAIFRALAEQNGAAVRAPMLEEEAPSLLDLAIENAREGCVRETHGALVVLHQSRHAKTPEIREAFAMIADDEIAHAALSQDLATWFETRLTLHEQAIVARARRDAARALRDAAAQDPLDEFLGMPTLEKGRAMFDDLFTRLDAEQRRPIPRRRAS